MTPKNVRARRIALGMTVDELARALGIPAEILQRFEQGGTELPLAESFRPILDHLERKQPDETNP